MIDLTSKLLIGNSYDEEYISSPIVERTPTQESSTLLRTLAILNVAYDMPRKQTSLTIDYAHIGLIDGPGNRLTTYSCAVLTLATLLDRYDKVLVCCHNGWSRSLAVAVMYLILKAGKISDHPTIFNHWRTWNQVLNELRYNTEIDLPEPHWVHREAADRLPYSLLERIL